MSNCCNSGISLGCFDVCTDIDTGLLALETGVHTLEITFLSLKIKKDVTLAIGDPILVPKAYVNENAEHGLRILQPSGAYFASDYNFKTTPCIIVS